MPPPRFSLPALLLCASLLAPLHGSERAFFSQPFAPAEPWVKPMEMPYRQSFCLNGLWQFQPVALPKDFKEGESTPPHLGSPNLVAWEPIRIPSPWNVNSFAEFKGLGCDMRTFPSYPKEWESARMGWLRRQFRVPADWKGRRIVLRFSAIAGDAQVLVNGKEVGRHFGIFFPCEFDITEAVLDGQNELMVGIRKASLFDRKGEHGRRTYQGGSFWGQHIVGIWDDVHLLALPQVRVADAFIKPLMDKDRLEVELTLQNDSAQEVPVCINAAAYRWLSKAGKDLLNAANPSSQLENKEALELGSVQATIAAHGRSKLVLHAQVGGRLKLWSPQEPNLYGLIFHTRVADQIVDSKYTRFGWRQISLEGTQFLLNGKPLVLKGDSWHFMGVPQMSRRYAWAWFKALRDANLNAVRLHAQPYPSFYLDVADEVGMLVLDETAIWASDGGPKLDDDAYWRDSVEHVESLVLRDRNHPSVFGWSVSNEVLPIVNGVFRKPPGMQEKLVQHYGLWAEAVRKADPTRPWISADGEEDGHGRLPTYIVHYGGEQAMLRGAQSGKPWGVGEAGNAYYGTPEQVSSSNGSRAYESFLGRMEGVALSSYESLRLQAAHNAVYRSVFNLVWYALKPLPLGMRDTSRPPTIEDGIHFSFFEEGRPGMQPERLGPYSTTLNPGYTSELPLYETWPLFDAIRAASSEPPAPYQLDTAPQSRPSFSPPAAIASLKVLGGAGSTLVSELKQTGVPVTKLESAGQPQLLFVDGIHPPGPEARALMEAVLAAKGTVVVWGVGKEQLAALNALLPEPLEVGERNASSLLPVQPSPVTAGLAAADLYYSELVPPLITTQGLSGKFVHSAELLLKACDTDWLRWNKQPENGKTAMVVRSELEAKGPGAVLVSKTVGAGRMLVTTLPAAPRLAKQEKTVRTILANLGIELGKGRDVGQPLLKDGSIVRALACGSFAIESLEKGADAAMPFASEETRANLKSQERSWMPVQCENGLFDLQNIKFQGPKQNAAAYLSFWVSSPRDLTDLLIEPNIPVVGLEVAADDALQVWLNGKEAVRKIRTGPLVGGAAKVEALKLRQGWNHLLIKVIQGGGQWQFTGKLTCNQPDFLAELESALERP